jgi:hypothetical protein
MYYLSNTDVFRLSDDFLDEHRRVLESRLQPVIREITDSRARTREELESLYRKIVSAVLLRSGLGSPTDIAVVREATGNYTVYKDYLSISNNICFCDCCEVWPVIQRLLFFNF